MGLLGVLFGLVFVISVIMIINAGIEYYCERNPSVILDDTCFDISLRCDWECDNYDLNFTGYIGKQGCVCQCSDGSFVSFCSGIRYNEEGKKVRNVNELQ